MFPFFCELPDGAILAAHQMGEAFESVDGTSCVSVNKNGGLTWGKPYRMFDKSNELIPYSDCCKISKLGDGRLVALGYEFERVDSSLPLGNPETGGLLDNRVFISFSGDNGKTWAPRTEVVSKAFTPNIEASAPITVLQDGSWATPVTNFPKWDGSITHKRHGRLLRSYDNGATWSDDAVCMEFDGNVTCYEMRMCQLENGAIVVIGWNEDAETGERLNNHYTISTDNGKTFSRPISTGIRGQASSVCAIGGNKLLALHAVRRDTDRPGIYACIVDLSGGAWNIAETEVIWEPPTPIIKSTKMAETFSFLRFGQPGAILLRDGNALVSFWLCESGQYMTKCLRLEI